MAHATTPATLDATVLPEDRRSGRKTGIGASILAALSAVRAGITASHRYETLRAHGVPHNEAIDRAFAELGFGS